MKYVLKPLINESVVIKKNMVKNKNNYKDDQYIFRELASGSM